MTLLLKMSRVGVKRESMEKDEVEEVGDEGDTKEGGLSLSLLPKGRDGDDRILSLDLTGSGRCVLERSRMLGRGEVFGDEDWSEGFEEFRRSAQAARLLEGLFALFIYTSISLARSRRVGAALLLLSHFCTMSVVISDSGSDPVSIPVLFTAPVLQLTVLSDWGFFLFVGLSSSFISVSEAWWFFLVELRRGLVSLRLSGLPDRSKDFGLSFFGRTLHGPSLLLGLDISLWPLPVTETWQNRLSLNSPKFLSWTKIHYIFK